MRSFRSEPVFHVALAGDRDRPLFFQCIQPVQRLAQVLHSGQRLDVVDQFLAHPQGMRALAREVVLEFFQHLVQRPGHRLAVPEVDVAGLVEVAPRLLDEAVDIAPVGMFPVGGLEARVEAVDDGLALAEIFLALLLEPPEMFGTGLVGRCAGGIEGLPEVLAGMVARLVPLLPLRARRTDAAGEFIRWQARRR